MSLSFKAGAGAGGDFARDSLASSIHFTTGAGGIVSESESAVAIILSLISSSVATDDYATPMMVVSSAGPKPLSPVCACLDFYNINHRVGVIVLTQVVVVVSSTWTKYKHGHEKTRSKDKNTS